MSDIKRRDFLKASAGVAAGTALGTGSADRSCSGPVAAHRGKSRQGAILALSFRYPI